MTVHSVEEAGGVHFITMELVKGQTLAAMLPGKGFGLGKFFEIAIPRLLEAVVERWQGLSTHEARGSARKQRLGFYHRRSLPVFPLARG